jgi:proteasome lid subunit RPN8/RPN11
LAKQKVTAISGKLLRGLLAGSRSAYESEKMHEFSCFLLAEDGVIVEFWLGPGTIASERYALLRLYNLPIDFRRVGTAHSHPSGNNHPSDEDLRLFAQTGQVHIIMGYPFDMNSWRAYSRYGEEIHLDVI